MLIKLLSSLTGKIIEIVVGTEREGPTTFSAHEEVLRESSSFFNKALSHNWKEATEHVVKLPQDDPDTFHLYMHWLYTGTLPYEEKGYPWNTILIDAYILGDKLQFTDFCDAVIDAIIDNLPADDFEALETHHVVTIYKHTQRPSPLRRLAIDFYVFHGEEWWLIGPGDEALGIGFLRDLAVALFCKEDREDPVKQPDQCEYHCHDDVDPCYRQKCFKRKRVKKE